MGRGLKRAKRMSDYVLDGDHDVHEDEFGDENGKEDVSVTDEMHFDAVNSTTKVYVAIGVRGYQRTLQRN